MLGLVALKPIVVPPVVTTPKAKITVFRKPKLTWRIKQFVKNLLDGSFFVPTYAKIANKFGLACFYGTLYGRKIHGDGSVTNYGLLGRRVVTTAGVNFLAATLDGTNSSSLFKFHGYGTGTTAEATGDTALVTELTTQYAVDNTRPTGSQAHSTNTYTTVGTLTPDSGGTIAVTEQGVFSASSSTTLLDRTKFTAVNLDSTVGDSLQTTYVFTLPAGG